MTHRSRNGGPPRTHRKPKKTGTERRKLHHPPSSNLLTGSETAGSTASAIRSDHPLLSSPSDTDILALIRLALGKTLDADDFIETVQKIKGLLYDKKWLEVFEDPALLDAYAGRWVPSRVLCFRDLLLSSKAIRRVLLGNQADVKAPISDGESEGSEDSDEEEDEDEDEASSADEGSEHGSSAEKVTADMADLRVADDSASAGGSGSGSSSGKAHILSLGGGAGSELLAFASIMRGAHLASGSSSADRKGKGKEIVGGLHWTGADIGAWDGVLSTLRSALNTHWALGAEHLQHEYIRTNLLQSLASAPASAAAFAAGGQPSDPSAAALHASLAQSGLITLLFTLTELFTQARVSALRFLRQLTAQTKPGTLFLVADSASDLSEFEIGTQGRKWPVYYILDTALLGKAAFAQAPKDADADGSARTDGQAKKVGTEWELLDESDSRWYRLPQVVAANWPVKLENTRYWYRLYRRI